MIISQTADAAAAAAAVGHHCVPEHTAWPPSNAGSFAVLLPLLVRLVAHGGVTGARRPRTAPFTRVSLGSRLPWDALAARVADPIEAPGSLDPCGALGVMGKEREKSHFKSFEAAC